jgi:hypothetical protein
MKVYVILAVMACMVLGALSQTTVDTATDAATAVTGGGGDSNTDASMEVTTPSGAGVLQFTLVSLLLPAIAALFQ